MIRWFKEKKIEWTTATEIRSIKAVSVSNPTPLRRVGEGDTIYVQAEGLIPNCTVICDCNGDNEMTGSAPFQNMLQAGWTSGTAGLKTKLWSCFSGYFLAEEFYNSAHSHFPKLVVDGYQGETRLAQPRKQVKPLEPYPDSTQIDMRKGVEIPDVDAKSRRVRFPKPAEPAPLVGSKRERSE